MKRPLAALLLLASVLVLRPARAADDGKAEGSMSVNGKAVSLKYAYSYVDSSGVRVVLSDVPLAFRDVVLFPDAISARRKAGKVHALRLFIAIDDKGGLDFGDTDIEHGGFKDGWTPSIRGKDKIELTALDEKKIAGRAHTEKPLKFGETGDVFEYDVTFSAPVHPWDDAKGVIYSPAPEPK